MEEDTKKQEGMRQNIKGCWEAFGKIVLHPMTIVTLLLVVLLNIANASVPKENSLFVLLNVLLTIISGVAGSIMYKRATDISENKPITIKGKSAIRNLKFLLNDVSESERIASDYLARIKEAENNKVLYKEWLREIIYRYWLLKEAVVDSIENWIDIIPKEADIKTQIGELTKLTLKIIKKEHEMEDVQNKAKQEGKDKESEIAELKDEINILRASLDEQATATFGPTLAASGTFPTLGSGLSYLKTSDNIYASLERTCKQCGGTYIPSGLAAMASSKCPTCSLADAIITTQK